MPQSILIIEDDNRLAEMVHDYLESNGYAVEIAPNGVTGISKQNDQKFDAIILDLMLPDIDGLEICRIIKSSSDVPIIMLTAKGEPMDRVVGLELGADDYMGKPFEPRELLARLRAITRRGRAAAEQQVLYFGRLEIDPNSMVARLNEKDLNLTSHQFQLLHILAKSAGRILSRDTLMDQLKGEDFDIFDRSIDVHISRIRTQIEDDPKDPRRIVTVRGAGYVFANKQD
ncbi:MULTISPECIES: response regulator [unclassified Lentilitoribacter]|jgi:DNA-binding response OmpR family regulator|uniref:response regulator n=1 Tax=unclassified Lentilitoribacter TaxID=2647570 RepID=UPI0013A6AFEB|nr:response regulator transcription factor [Lentilitoribacter sp. Alg239-R112]